MDTSSYLGRTIKSLGERHRLKTVGPYRDARVSASRKRRLRDVHRIQLWRELWTPRRQKRMGRGRLRMGIYLVGTADSVRVCEQRLFSYDTMSLFQYYCCILLLERARAL
jgi:hypothetical protein